MDLNSCNAIGVGLIFSVRFLYGLHQAAGARDGRRVMARVRPLQCARRRGQAVTFASLGYLFGRSVAAIVEEASRHEPRRPPYRSLSLGAVVRRATPAADGHHGHESSTRARIPTRRLGAGRVSLFMDMSSGTRPPFCPCTTTVLGLSVFGGHHRRHCRGHGIDAAEGGVGRPIGFSGASRLRLLGYGLAAITKPRCSRWSTRPSALSQRLCRPCGQRHPRRPCDAIVADVTPPALRDAAFELRQSLDTVAPSPVRCWRCCSFGFGPTTCEQCCGSP